MINLQFVVQVSSLSFPNTYDVLLNSPKLSLQFPCKKVGRILFVILDKLLL